MKRLISLACMLLMVVASFAYDAKIDGIYYNFNESFATVTYRYRDYNKHIVSDYTGSVTIPESIIYNGRI